MMRTKVSLLLIGLLTVGIFTAGCGSVKQTPPAATQQPVELTISAAVSLKDALAEIKDQYQAKNPGIKLLYNFGASGALQKQIEEGAPADIFISAAMKQMDELEAKNLINKTTRSNLVENKLVIVLPKDSKLAINKLEDLAQDDVKKLALGETVTVPAGQYAQEALKHVNVWEQIKDKVVFAKDVRTVLTYVETGNVDAGIVYKTDALSSEKVKIAAMAPEGSHQPVVYPAAIVTATQHMQEADAFLAYLHSTESRAVFEKYGFAMGQ